MVKLKENSKKLKKDPKLIEKISKLELQLKH